MSMSFKIDDPAIQDSTIISSTNMIIAGGHGMPNLADVAVQARKLLAQLQSGDTVS